MEDIDFQEKAKHAIAELLLSISELGAVGAGTLTFSKIVMSYAVPLVAQLGFGSTLGTSVIRAGLVGSADLGVGLASSLLGTAGLKWLSLAYVVHPVTTGAVYASVQYGATRLGVPYLSEGVGRDFTFATLSAATSTMFSASLALVAAGTLFSVRLDNRLERELAQRANKSVPRYTA